MRASLTNLISTRSHRSQCNSLASLLAGLEFLAELRRAHRHARPSDPAIGVYRRGEHGVDATTTHHPSTRAQVLRTFRRQEISHATVDQEDLST